MLPHAIASRHADDLTLSADSKGSIREAAVKFGIFVRAASWWDPRAATWRRAQRYTTLPASLTYSTVSRIRKSAPSFGPTRDKTQRDA